MKRGRTTARTAGLLAVTTAAVLALAGCSGGSPWPSGGVASSGALPPPEAAPVTSAPASPAAGTGDGTATGTGGTDGTGARSGAGSGRPGGGTAPGTATRCTTGELRLSLGPPEGAAGSVIQTVILTNTSGRTCTLRGFPGVSYVQGTGLFQLGPSAAMVGDRGGDVRLGPGGVAGAELRLVNVRNYDPAVCRPAPAQGIRVYPPGDTQSLVIGRPDSTGCAGDPPGNQLEIKTLRAR